MTLLPPITTSSTEQSVTARCGPLSLRDTANALGGEVSGNRVLAPGPGHSAKDRSLSVKLAPNRPDGIVVHSFANDDWQACKDHVKDRLGIKWEPERSNKLRQDSAVSTGRKIVGEYVYRNADGTPHAMVVRTDPKGFFQKRWNGTAWESGGAKPLIPYRLPQLKAAEHHNPVFVVEGEKDCDNLAKLGFIATTNIGGAGNWQPELNEHFVGKTVFILPDNDEKGAKHAADVARHLAPIAASVRIVNLPDLPVKGDVSDWLANGGEHGKLVELCEAAPVLPTTETVERGQPKTWRDNVFDAATLRTEQFEPVRYMLPDLIPEGVTLLVGKPKIGKSWLALDLGIAAADGQRYALGDLKPRHGDILYLALEDNKRRLKKRIAKLLPDSWPWPNRLRLVNEWRRADAGGIDDLRDWCRSVEKPTLILIDTLQKFRPTGKGADSYASDYNAVTELQSLTKDFPGLCIIVLHHDRKMGADDVFDTVSGTQGITGAADTILVLKRDNGAVKLHVRGRDVEESETPLRFEKSTCKWVKLGAEDAEAALSQERQAVLEALEAFEPATERDGMSVPEIMVATGRSDRNAVDQLLYKMREAGEIKRVRRGVYLAADGASKISKKERNEPQTSDNKEEGRKLTNLTDLTGVDQSGAAEWSEAQPRVGHYRASASAAGGYKLQAADGSGQPLDQRICGQCKGGLSTYPASDAPTERVQYGDSEIWLHPQCIRFWKAENPQH